MDALLQDFQSLADLVPYRIDGQIQLLGNLLVFESVTFAEDKDLSAFSGRLSIAVHIRASVCALS